MINSNLWRGFFPQDITIPEFHFLNRTVFVVVYKRSFPESKRKMYLICFYGIIIIESPDGLSISSVTTIMYVVWLKMVNVSSNILNIVYSFYN